MYTKFSLQSFDCEGVFKTVDIRDCWGFFTLYKKQNA